MNENKKCPQCGAEIQENARFCLYCMSSLDEKETFFSRVDKKWWWIIGSAVLLLLALGVGLFFLLRGEEKTPQKEPISQSQSGESAVGGEESEPSDPQNEGQNSSAVGGEVSGSSSQESMAPSGGNQTPNKPTDGDQPQTTPSNGNSAQSTPAGDSVEEQTPSVEEPASSTPPASSEEQPATAAVFAYRAAQYAVDDYQVTSNVEGCVVITGIESPASDGIYHIPETIEGKTVIAITSHAFLSGGYAQTVKAVYIPATLRTVWGSAFVGCYNLQDVYLCGKSIYISSDAFPSVSKRNGTLTIHCSADCNNRDLRYYRNIAESYYDAVYKEWNG